MASDKKNLVIAFVKFLKTEISSGELSEEAVEGLEVSMQCLESAYDIEGETPNPDIDLLGIFQRNVPKNNVNPSKDLTSENDRKTAEEEKMKGNNFMKEEKYADAIESYTRAIQIDKRNAIYYCNRAAAYTKLENNTQAISDCKEALRIDPSYGKAYSRMGLAYLAEKDYEKAADCYEKALNYEPDNASYKSNLNIAREHVTKQKQQQPSSQNASSNPLAGVDLNSLLSNPAVMNMAQSFMQNPAMQNMFQNMMGGMGGPPSSTADTAEGADEDTLTRESQAQQGANQTPGGFPFPQGLDFGNIMSATQQVAAQLREQNPDLADSLRQQFEQGQQPPPQDGNQK